MLNTDLEYGFTVKDMCQAELLVYCCTVSKEWFLINAAVLSLGGSGAASMAAVLEKM